jgi:hypothetical protein
MASAAAEVAGKGTTATDVALPSLSSRVQLVDDWEEATRTNRELSTRDRDYVDNHQLTETQLALLRERGQPPIIKNRIARKVNFILGEEIRQRVNPCAKPRTPQQQDDAGPATDGLRFAADEEKFDQCRSAVFRNMVVEGYGGALKEMEDCGDGVLKHRLRHIEWDRLAYDQHSRAHDFGDASWLAIIKWVDVDEAIKEFPDAKEAIKAAVESSTPADSDSADDSPRGWVSSKRKRIKLVEQFLRVDYDYYRFVFTGNADVVEPARTWLLDEDRQYSVCPLIMESCYIDRNGNRYGVVRQIISPQDMLNKASSKALNSLSVNQVISEEGAISDPDAFQEQIAKPDGFATGVRPGGLQDGAVVVKNGSEFAMAQFQLIQESKRDIDEIGPTSASIPDLPNTASGVAFQRRQQAANQELGTIFDQIRDWQWRVFCADWLAIRLCAPEDWWIRVTDDQELTGFRFVALNRRTIRSQRLQELLSKQPPPPLDKAVAAAAGEFAPRILGEAQAVIKSATMRVQQMAQAAQQGQVDPKIVEQAAAQVSSPDYIVQIIMAHPLMQQPVTANQVSKMMVDIVLDEAPDTAILAEEEFQTLSELAPSLIQVRPDMAPILTKMMIRASQMPNKRELIKELEKEPDQQQQQMAQQQQAMQQQMVQLQMALQQATIAVEQTKAQLQQAQTQKTVEEAKKIAIDASLAPAKAEVEVANKHIQAISTAADVGAKTIGDANGTDQAQALQATTNPG